MVDYYQPSYYINLDAQSGIRYMLSSLVGKRQKVFTEI